MIIALQPWQCHRHLVSIGVTTRYFVLRKKNKIKRRSLSVATDVVGSETRFELAKNKGVKAVASPHSLLFIQFLIVSYPS